MALLPGKYELLTSENVVPYLVSIGVPEDKANEFEAKKSTVEVSVDGKNVTVKGSLTNTYVLDEETIEDSLLGQPLKTRATLNGNTLTVTSTAADGQTGSRVYVFSETGLTVTLIPLKAGVADAVRTYKRV